MMSFDAQRTLCSWGIHSHNKKAIFKAEGVKIKFMIPICPHCECPKRKYMKAFYPDGSVRINKKYFEQLEAQ